MMDSAQVFILVCLAGLFSFGMGLILGISSNENHWCAEAIKRGLARYHPVTGAWEWIDGSDTKER